MKWVHAGYVLCAIFIAMWLVSEAIAKYQRRPTYRRMRLNAVRRRRAHPEIGFHAAPSRYYATGWRAEHGRGLRT